MLSPMSHKITVPQFWYYLFYFHELVQMIEIYSEAERVYLSPKHMAFSSVCSCRVWHEDKTEIDA